MFVFFDIISIAFIMFNKRNISLFIVLVGFCVFAYGNDTFTNGKHNDINYIFDGSIIKDYVIKISFDKNHIPTYEFVKNGKSWNLVDFFHNEYHYDGTSDKNKARGFKINPANFYRYDGYNPLSHESDAHTERFQFYAMLHCKAMVVELNNYLIAIDTYSKFVFTYGKITKTKRVFGSDVPIAFEAVENHGEHRKFYEYDPIGIIEKDGDKLTIKLYDEFIDEYSEKLDDYFPSIHDTSRNIATKDAPGLSPYYQKADFSE